MNERYFTGISTGLPSYVWDSQLKKSVCDCELEEDAELICDALNEKHERDQAYAPARSII